MDLATLIGMLGAFGIVIMAMVLGGSVGIFVNVPSLLIVIVGSLMVVLMKFSLGQFLGAVKVAGKAFIYKLDKIEELIPLVVELADVARKGGLLALEGKEVNNPFLKEGIKMLVDGHDSEVVREMLVKDMKQTEERHGWGAKVFMAMGDVAPAMGMIGTLVGLVAMLSNMDDPKAIGPAMAVALLTTFYGAILGTVIMAPLAVKLEKRSRDEALIMNLIRIACVSIAAQENPRKLEMVLNSELPPSERIRYFD